MLARLVDQLPTSWWYEPKWDGFRAVVFRAGSEVLIESRNNRPMARYFPVVTVPDDQCQDIKDVSTFVKYGWGMIPTKVRIGRTEWKTAI